MKLETDQEIITNLSTKREFPDFVSGSLKEETFSCHVKREIGVQCGQVQCEVKHEVGAKREQFSTLALACSSVWKQPHHFSPLRTSTPLPSSTAASSTAFSTTPLPPASALKSYPGMKYLVGQKFLESIE